MRGGRGGRGRKGRGGRGEGGEFEGRNFQMGKEMKGSGREEKRWREGEGERGG